MSFHKKDCYIAGNFFPTARSLIGYFEVMHMTSNNETVSPQNLWARNIAKNRPRILTDDRRDSKV